MTRRRLFAALVGAGGAGATAAAIGGAQARSSCVDTLGDLERTLAEVAAAPCAPPVNAVSIREFDVQPAYGELNVVMLDCDACGKDTPGQDVSFIFDKVTAQGRYYCRTCVESLISWPHRFASVPTMYASVEGMVAALPTGEYRIMDWSRVDEMRAQLDTRISEIRGRMTWPPRHPLA